MRLPTKIRELVTEDVERARHEFDDPELRWSEEETWADQIDAFDYWEHREGCTSEHMARILDHDSPRIIAAMTAEWFRQAREV